MSKTIVLDPAEMYEAAPRVTELHLNLVDAARIVGSLDLGVDMPPGVRGRVAAQLTEARTGLLAAARQVEGLGADMARRAGLAELADSLRTVWLATKPIAASLAMANAFHRSRARAEASRGRLDLARLNRDYARRIEGLSRMLRTASRFVRIVPSTVADARNEFLTTEQKVGRGVARVGVPVVAGAAEKAAVGAATRFAVGRGAGMVAAAAVGGPVGIGVAVAWTVLDAKFKLTDRIADGAAWAAGKVGDGAQWFDDHALDPAGDFAKDRAGDAVDTAGDVVDAAGDAVDTAGDVVDVITR